MLSLLLTLALAGCASRGPEKRSEDDIGAIIDCCLCCFARTLGRAACILGDQYERFRTVPEQGQLGGTQQVGGFGPGCRIGMTEG